MTNYTKKAVKGAVIILLMSFIAGFLGYIVRVILAKNLSVEDFGLFYSVFSFLGFFGIFKSLGFDRALIKFIPEYLSKKNFNMIKSSVIYVTAIQLVMNLIFIILIYLLSDFLSIYFFQTNKASLLLKLMTIAFFIDSFVMIIKFSFQGFQKMHLFSGMEIVRMVLITLFVLVFFWMDMDLMSPVFAYIIVPSLLLIIFTYILLKRTFPEFRSSKIILSKIRFKQISRYSLWTMVSSVGVLILGYTDTLTLTYFSGLKNVGLYNVALPTAGVLAYFYKAIAGVLVPISSELWTKNKKSILSEGIESLYKYSMIIILPIVVTIVVFSDLVIQFFFGVEFLPASPALKVLGIGVIFTMLHSINTRFLAGIGKPKICSMIVYIAAVLNLILNLILIPIYGIIGAAVTTAISYIVMMIIGFFYIKKFLPVKFPIHIWLKTITSGIVFTIIIISLSKIIFINTIIWAMITVIIGFIAYTLMVLFLKAISIKEINLLFKRIFS